MDGDTPAAMRYTEAKLSKLAEVMLNGVSNNAVDMQRNYSETFDEPKLLPAAFPLLLCNGASGIAVGYTTEIPSHNLKEVANAIIALIKNKDITIKELMKYVKGPDACNGSLLINNEEVTKLYETGKGKLTYKAKYHIETTKNGNDNIVITELPPDVNKLKLVEKLYKLCIEEKKIPRVSSVKDLSTKDIKIVIELQKTAITDMVVQSLFDMTELTKNCSYILRAIKDNTPSIFNLKEILEHYLVHRQNCIRNEHISTLEKKENRLHVQNGLVKVTNNLSKAISIIEKSDNDEQAKNGLIKEFNIDDIQAEAVLEFKLRRLTKLNKDDILNLIQSLENDIANIKELLSDKNKMDEYIIAQLEELKTKFGDDRRTEIITETVKNDNKDVTLILTNKSNIKVISEEAFKEAADNNALKERQEVYIKKINCTMDDIFLLILDNGNYLKTDFNGLMALNAKNNIVGVYTLTDEIADKYIICLTKLGLIQKIKVSGFKSRLNKQAVIFKNWTNGDNIVAAKLISSDKNNVITLATKHGIMHRFYEASFKDNLSAGKNGLSALTLAEGDQIIGFDVSTNDTNVILYTKHEHGFGIKRLDVNELNIKGRVGKGYSAITFYKKNLGEVYKVLCIKDNYIDIDNKGKIHNINIEDLPLLAKNAKPNEIDYEPVAVNFN